MADRIELANRIVAAMVGSVLQETYKSESFQEVLEVRKNIVAVAYDIVDELERQAQMSPKERDAQFPDDDEETD